MHPMKMHPSPRPHNGVTARYLPYSAIETLEARRFLSTTVLDFGGAGGISHSGFTGALATQKGRGVVANNLSVGNGVLRVTTTAGDMYSTRNSQDNALDLPLDGTKNFTVQTRLVILPFTHNFQSGGIFVGTNENNYVKLIAGYNGGDGHPTRQRDRRQIYPRRRPPLQLPRRQIP